MNCYMGIDPSLTGTGVFILNEDGSNSSCEIKTSLKGYENSLKRVDYIAEQVVELINKHKPIGILMEDYFVGRQPMTVIKLAELGTVLRIRILENGNNFFVTKPSQLKKFVTGAGNCGKDLILKCVFKKWNVDVSSNNIADACGMAYMCRAVHNQVNEISQELLKYEAEVLKLYSIESYIKPYTLK